MTVAEGGYYGWISVFCSFYHHAFVSSAVYALSVYYGSWVEDFNTGRGVTSWVLTLSMAISMGSGPVAASLCTKYGHRQVIIAGSIICALGFFLSSFATSIYAIVLLIGGLSGFGLGMQFLPSLAIIPFYFHKRRSLAIGVAVSGAGVGVFLYPPFLIWLEEQYTWRGAMLILSGISLNMVVCGALIRPVNENVDVVEKPGLPECVSSEYIPEKSRSNLCVNHAYGTNPVKGNGSVINGSLRHLGTPVAKVGHGVTNFSSVNDVRNTFFCDNKLSGSAYIVSPDHFLVSSNHFMTEAGSHRSLGQSHVDIYLSSSVFDLDEADKKWNDSVRQLHRLDSEEARTSHPPSHLDSLLHLGNDNHQKSPSTCNSPRPKITDRATFGLCCRKLPTKYLDMLKSPVFLSLGFSYVLVCFTCLVPVVYIVDRAVDNGIDKAEAALAFSMYGAGNLFGRVAIGLFADHAFDSLILAALCLMISGVSTCLSPLCGASAVLHGLYGFTFGTCMGGSVTLTPLILVDLLGLDMVNRSFGLILVFHATGFVLGTPLAGRS